MRIAGQHRCLSVQGVPELPAKPGCIRIRTTLAPVARFIIGAILSAVLIAAGKKSANAQTPESATDLWGPVPTKDASLANLAPLLLPYLNNGLVFGMPGTDVGDFWHRTQLTGDWGGARTYLARHGFFFDLYSISAYQDVTAGGLKTGGAFVQNTQLSISVDTGRAGLWPGGLLHVALESRFGDSAQSTFTVGSALPQYYGLSLPGPLLTHKVLPTEYFLVQSLSTQFSVILGKIDVLNAFDQTMFGDSYKYYFANFNFNKTPQAPNISNTTSLAAVGIWRPTPWVTLVGAVLDPNSQADNLASNAFDKVNIYTASIFSYKVGHLPGQAWAQGAWTNKPKIDLGSPFGPLPPGTGSQALGVLLGSASPQGLPTNFKPNTWVTVGNFSQYLWVKDDSTPIAEKLGAGKAAPRGVGVFGRAGYGPQETNPITRDASIALLARGLSDYRKDDSFGVGFYYDGISGPLKDDIAQLTGNQASVKNEKGTEIFYDLAITPAIRLIPSYQHIWNPLTAEVVTNQRGADVFNIRLGTTW
jgi:porin